MTDEDTIKLAWSNRGPWPYDKDGTPLPFYRYAEPMEPPSVLTGEEPDMDATYRIVTFRSEPLVVRGRLIGWRVYGKLGETEIIVETP